MRNRVDRLRIWLVAGASLLLLVVAGFLGYARYRSRLFLAGLPGRLGANITRETDGYTYSQTVEGRTVFTLHAGRMEQRRDGLVKLHDVGVVVYGRKQDRADRIYGKEFEYDQAAGIVRALGTVNLDLQAPSLAEGKKQGQISAVGASLASSDARVIHVTTSGLVYLTKLGVAATAEDVAFSAGQITGQAHGADFNSDTGIVVLQSAVRVNGPTANGPMMLTASRAELDRSNQVTTLAGARLITNAETVEAAQAVIHVRKDGSPERVEGSGKVTIARTDGGVLHADKGEATLNAQSKPLEARFGGGVRFAEDQEGRHAEGQAAQAQVRFDTSGLAEHVSLAGGVSMAEQDAGNAARAAGHRTFSGTRMEVVLGPAAQKGRKTEAREVQAFGEARLVMVSNQSSARPGHAGQTTTDLSGDRMTARFASGQRIDSLIAQGHTVMHQADEAGTDERSAGDTTELTFRPDRAAASTTLSGGQSDLQQAVQTGHVTMVRAMGKGEGSAATRSEQRGTAEHAVFDGESDRITLSGGVLLSDSSSMVWGAKVVVERATGDATAEGGVRVTYLQAAQGASDGDPIHILADHAALRQSGANPVDGAAKPSPNARGGNDHAFFYGVPGKPARLWQSGSQVEAPVLEFAQAAKRLIASGSDPGSLPQVHAVLVSSGEGSGRQTRPGNGAVKGKSPATVRVTSREMVYTDGAREVVFTGAVLVEDADGRMRANRATAFLQQRATAKPGLSQGPRPPQEVKGGTQSGSLFGGSVERIVAAGNVELDQPGRHGAGEQLVYTASDGMFVLTGTAAAPPRMSEDARGTVTGYSLRFHAGDDSVVVTSAGIQGTSGASGALGSPGANVATKRVRTETRVKQQ